LFKEVRDWERKIWEDGRSDNNHHNIFVGGVENESNSCFGLTYLIEGYTSCRSTLLRARFSVFRSCLSKHHVVEISHTRSSSRTPDSCNSYFILLCFSFYFLSSRSIKIHRYISLDRFREIQFIITFQLNISPLHCWVNLYKTLNFQNEQIHSIIFRSSILINASKASFPNCGYFGNWSSLVRSLSFRKQKRERVCLDCCFVLFCGSVRWANSCYFSLSSDCQWRCTRIDFSHLASTTNNQEINILKVWIKLWLDMFRLSTVATFVLTLPFTILTSNIFPTIKYVLCFVLFFFSDDWFFFSSSHCSLITWCVSSECTSVCHIGGH
jgi:hypothetical protein